MNHLPGCNGLSQESDRNASIKSHAGKALDLERRLDQGKSGYPIFRSPVNADLQPKETKKMSQFFNDHHSKGTSIMHYRIWLAMALALLVTLGAISGQPPATPEGVKALEGEWVYVEDRTEGRTKEQQGPNMGPRVRMRVEKDAVVLVRTDGEIRLPLDGSPTDVVRSFGTSRYRGEWKDGAYVYESMPVREGDTSGKGLIRWKLRITADGMLAGVTIDPPMGKETVSLFRHPKDIALPTPAKATLEDLKWVAGAWVGTRGAGGTTSIEERWSPPGGGAMLATSRTISRGKLSAFEYLPIDLGKYKSFIVGLIRLEKGRSPAPMHRFSRRPMPPNGTDLPIHVRQWTSGNELGHMSA